MISLHGVCTLGRASASQVTLTDRRASRRHALIQPQGDGEFWLVDFGSANGTLINGRRVTQPTLLREGDQVKIGDEILIFHVRQGEAGPRKVNLAGTNLATLVEIKTMDCWLLVLDIKGSTELSVRCSPEELPVMLGRWFAHCRETIEGAKGEINKFLGDGLFAYWSEPPAATASVKHAVQALCQAQARSQPGFRWVLHHGPVAVGGAMAMSEASLLGREVNFAFRMEKLAGQLGCDRLLSRAACAKLGLLETCRREGAHLVSGFEGVFEFYSF
ncbi:MAG TPA: adenylate/guanylate cyclase domain-containing protein [Verrucomicrobiae bacterium]|nr:adenylate/guanylate cyclase domain-containing protein [Verrucomicrobiae bacterium]